MVKNLSSSAGNTKDSGSIPGSVISPRGGNGNPLQYSCLENSHGQRSLVDSDHGFTKEWDMT